MEEEFADAIAIVSDQLGIAAEHIYDVFVAAQPVVGMVNIGMVIGVLSICVLVGVVVYRELKKLCIDSDNKCSVEESFWIMVVSVIAVLITITVGSIVAEIISGQLMKILCPEYSAIQEIFRLMMR